MIAVEQEPKKIDDLIQSKCLKLSHSTMFESAVMHLGQRDDGVALVVDDRDQLLGIIRNHELVKALVNKQFKTATIADFMVTNPPTITTSMSLREACKVMFESGLGYLPVLDEGKIKGTLSWATLQGAMLAELARTQDHDNDLVNQLRCKDDYLGVVSHDIRTPLSVISLCCDYLMSETSLKSLSASQKSFVERIRRNTANATSMVSDILDVVRLEKGFDLDYEDVEVDQFLGEVISNLRVIASEKNIEVILECQEHMVISMDPKRIIHVLENLVINAVKFSPSGKKVFVTAGSEDRNGESYLVFSVRDEGSGIKQEDEQKVFEELQQVATGVEKTLGIGLGLSIAKKFVALHQGIMEVDGGWQQGATFKALIPGVRLGANGGAEENRSKPRILVVEDDESIREYFVEELENAGYDVVSAVDGEQGVHFYFRYKPDVILSDIRMPNLDGLELLSRVRMTDRNIPFVLCSGFYPGLLEDLASSEHKPDAVLEKPASEEDLLKAVGQFISSANTP